MTGNIHSTLSFGTVDGPGIRYVIFMQGCPLRCLYCHNPDSWALNLGEEKTIENLIKDILKYKRYFKDNGGVTISGGEPLVQMEFTTNLCKRLKEEGINVCVDTSGITFNEENTSKFDELIKYVDLFLLDMKHIDEKKAIKLTGKSNINTINFSKYLSKNNIDVWIRYVLVPNYTSDLDDVRRLKEFLNTLTNIKKIEILPYHTMGKIKYKELNLDYPLDDVLEPTKELINDVKNILLKGSDNYV